jgi:hypothetical protein
MLTMTYEDFIKELEETTENPQKFRELIDSLDNDELAIVIKFIKLGIISERSLE